MKEVRRCPGHYCNGDALIAPEERVCPVCEEGKFFDRCRRRKVHDAAERLVAHQETT